MLNNPNPLLSKAEWYIHLRNLNPNHFQVVKGMRLKVVAPTTLLTIFHTILLAVSEVIREGT
jgi:hypothetical protein